MRKVLIATLLILMVCPLTEPASAEEGLPNILPEYRTPELRRHALILGGDLDGFRGYRHDYGSIEESDSYDLRRWKNLIIGAFNGAWSLDLDRPDLVSHFKLNLWTGGARSGSERRELSWEGKNSSSQRDLRFALGTSANRSHYFSGDLFLAYGFEADFLVIDFHREWKNPGSGGDDYSTSESDTGNRQHRLVLPLAMGIGRIHDVTDARLALYILEDLRKLDCLSRELERTEILDFAYRITELKNRRIFDSRERTIRNIQDLDHWLRERGLLNSSPALLFTSLYDFWQLEGQPVRRRGNRLSLALDPSYKKSNLRSEQLSSSVDGNSLDHHGYEITKTYWEPELRLELLSTHPLRKKLQLDLGGEFSFTYIRFEGRMWDIHFADNLGDTPDPPTKETITGYRMGQQIWADLGMHLNSRNSLIGRLDIRHDVIEYTRKEEDPKSDTLRKTTQLGLGLNWTHYLSLKTRLKAHLTQSWLRENDDLIDWQIGGTRSETRVLYSGIGFGISIEHTIF